MAARNSCRSIAPPFRVIIRLYYWICRGFRRERYIAKTSASQLPEAPQTAWDGPVRVLGPDADRELIRSLAKRLADNGPDSAEIRATLRRTVSGEPPKKGGILNACAGRLWLAPI